MKQTSYKELSQDDQELISAATEAMQKAYAPYSNFFVGAALRTKNGKIITGSNVENAAYGHSICAERTAVVKAVSEGIKEFESIAVIGKAIKGITSDEIVFPCGACRQVLYEMAKRFGGDIRVIASNASQTACTITSIYTLLPLGFGPTALNK